MMRVVLIVNRENILGKNMDNATAFGFIRKIKDIIY